MGWSRLSTCAKSLVSCASLLFFLQVQMVLQRRMEWVHAACCMAGNGQLVLLKFLHLELAVIRYFLQSCLLLLLCGCCYIQYSCLNNQVSLFVLGNRFDCSRAGEVVSLCYIVLMYLNYNGLHCRLMLM